MDDSVLRIAGCPRQAILRIKVFEIQVKPLELGCDDSKKALPMAIHLKTYVALNASGDSEDVLVIVFT